MHVVEIGPTFRSNLGRISLTPDGSAWIAETDGVVRITRNGHIAQKRRPDNCYDCSFTVPDITVMGNVVYSGGYAYVGLRDGTIAFAQSPTIASTVAPGATEPAAGSAVRVADGSVWTLDAAANRLLRTAPNGSVTQFDAARGPSQLANLITDARSTLWYDDTYYGRVYRRAANGTTTIYGNGLPVNSAPGAAVAASDGAVWFYQTLSWHPRLTRIAADGTVREYPIPNGMMLEANEALDPTGVNVEFVATDVERKTHLYEMTPSGTLHEGSTNGCFIAVENFVCGTGVPAAANVHAVYGVIGPDRALWFSDPDNSRIGRIDRNGHTEYFTRGLTRWNSGPQYMAVGPDNAIWFTEVRDRIGRISMDGTIREFGGLPARCFPSGIALGRDGNLWFTIYHGNELVRMTPSGKMTRFRDGIYPSRGNDSAVPDSRLTVGPDGTLWFNEPEGGRIGHAVM